MSDKVSMTIEELQRRVDHIKAIAGDDESAHSEEDDLRRDVLQAIADGNPIAAALASLALTTSEIEFSRWCA